MYHFAPISQRELAWAGAQIAFLIPVGSHVAICASHQRKASDVKFTPFVEERIRDVPLHYIASFFAGEEDHSIADDFSDWLQVGANLDPEASICVLAWLHDPVGWSFLALLFVLLIRL